MNHQTEQRPLCPECGKRITVKKDGTLRHHSNGIPQYVGSPWSRMCSGTGQAPLAHGESVATEPASGVKVAMVARRDGRPTRRHRMIRNDDGQETH